MATRTLAYRGALEDWWRRWSPPASDAWLYGLSTIFATLMWQTSSQPAQSHWGFLVLGPFLGAVVLSALLALWRPRAMQLARTALLALVFVGVVVVPLGIESHLAQGQPEVYVIDRAGQDLANGKPLFQTYLNSHGQLVHVLKGVPAFQSFFPYFPLMSLWGLPSAFTHSERGLPDSRVVMSLFTILLMAIALALMRASSGAKIRTAQVLCVLPTGSLFLATGGDDMPILALCLCTLVAIQRKNPWMAGILIGIAASMKLTAWPFLIIALCFSVDRHGKRGWPKVLVAASSILVASVTPFVFSSPKAFVANVFAFPLGLAGVSSPAASPLPGHLLTTWYPPLRHVLLPTVFVVGGYFLLRYLWRRWPLSLPTSLRVLAVVMLVVICSATATRLGYLIYPLDFFLWAWVVTPVPATSVESVVLVEAQSP